MTKEEIYERFKDQGCIAVYETGSTANPHIKSPRDTEFYAVFNTLDDVKRAEKIYNIHCVDKNWTPKRFFVWGYLHHYLNETDNFVGTKVTFKEPTTQQLLDMANGILNSKCYKKDVLCKWYYHVAMVKAIEKYGYHDIPQNVVDQINDIHDLKMTLSQFTI